MEFIRENYLNTTTMLTVNSNTGTAANLFTRDPFYQYYSDGLNNDATTASITVTFLSSPGRRKSLEGFEREVVSPVGGRIS